MGFHLQQRDGVSFLTSDVLAAVPGVVHAFSARATGLDGAAAQPLDLALRPSDEPESPTRGNWSRFLDAVGGGLGGLTYVVQKHGTAVRLAGAPGGCRCAGEGDALWTVEPAIGLAIQTADCVTVLFAAADGRVVAAAHAGWRGLVGGVVEATLAELKRRCEVGAEELVVASGPHIHSCCFEVQEDVAGPFRARFGPEVILQDAEGRLAISLDRALALLLGSLGVRPEAVDLCPECTCCQPELFFSYRRDRGRDSGRLAGLIGKRGASGQSRAGPSSNATPTRAGVDSIQR
jgi:hypothetical protein